MSRNKLASLLLASAMLIATAPAWAQEEFTVPLPPPGPEPVLMDVDLGDPPHELAVEFAAPMEGAPILEAFHGRPGGPSRGGKGIFSALTGDLALTDDQLEKLYNLRSQLLDNSGPKNLALRTNQRHLMEALASSDIDSKKVKDLQRQISSLRSELSDMRIDHMVQSANVLTAQQRKALRDKMIRSCVGGMCDGGKDRMKMFHRRFGSGR